MSDSLKKNMLGKTSILFQILVSRERWNNDFHRTYHKFVFLGNPDPEFDTELMSIFDIPVDKLFDTVTPSMRPQNGKHLS